jgi:hypothetical protein
MLCSLRSTADQTALPRDTQKSTISCEHIAVTQCPDAGKLDRSSTLVSRSFTETILLTTYHKYVTSIALGVMVTSRGISVYKRPRLHAGSTGRTPQRSPRAFTDPLSRHGLITATSLAVSIPQLPMRHGQTRRSACLPRCRHRHGHSQHACHCCLMLLPLLPLLMIHLCHPYHPAV